MGALHSVAKRFAAARALRIVAFLFLALLGFGLVAGQCQTGAVRVGPTGPGVTDLTQFDFANQVAELEVQLTNAIVVAPGHFYMPEDFTPGGADEAGPLYSGQAVDTLGDYGTIRMVLALPPGQAYAIAGKNIPYAQRLFIDGKECAPVGLPGTSLESTIPHTTRYAEGFAPTGPTTEIIFHYAVFVHADGGALYPLELGLVRKIVRNEQLRAFREAAAAIALGCAMLFFVGLVLFFPKNRYMLWFALLCGCVALLNLLTGDKMLKLLFPALPWAVAIRMETLAACGIGALLVLYINSLFPGAIKRQLLWVFMGLYAACGIFICFFPTQVFTAFTPYMTAIWIICCIVALAALFVAALRKKLVSPLHKTERITLFLGLFCMPFLCF